MIIGIFANVIVFRFEYANIVYISKVTWIMKNRFLVNRITLYNALSEYYLMTKENIVI